MTSMKREYGDEVFRQRTEVAQKPTIQGAPSRPTTMHPITWVVTAIVVALLSWDCWQTVQDVRHSRTLNHPYSGQRAEGKANTC
jgi:hypothetical protein